MNLPDDEVGPDTPIPLSQAIRLFFPLGGVSKSSLRLEARRGRLKITRIANRDLVTRRAIDAMLTECELPPAPPPAAKAPGPPPGRRGPSASDNLEAALKATPKRRHKGEKTGEIRPFPSPKDKG